MSGIGKLQKEWEAARLDEIISIYQSGIWGDSPSINEISYPIIRSTEITHDGKIDLSRIAFRKIPKEKVNKYNLKDGDILLVASSGSSHLIGRPALFKQPNDGKVYLFSNFMIRIRPTNINSNFLYYYFNSLKYYHFLRNLQQTSTGLRNLPKKEFLQFKIHIPPLPEQKKIAEILGTVDQAIEKVEEAIEKTQRLKKGLMQELLTKGIGHREFKETEVGKIPREWDVKKIKDVGDLQYGYTASAIKKDKGIRFVRITDINDNGKINWESVPTCKIDKNDYEKYKLKEGNILFARIGATTGKAAFINKKVEGVFASYLIRFRRSPKTLYSEFLYFFTQSKAYWLQVHKYKEGQLKKGLNAKILGNLVFSLPPIPEQHKIAEILNSVDKRIELLRNRKERLEKVKKGLMDDLLTGRKRVKLET